MNNLGQDSLSKGKIWNGYLSIRKKSFPGEFQWSLYTQQVQQAYKNADCDNETKQIKDDNGENIFS